MNIRQSGWYTHIEATLTTEDDRELQAMSSWMAKEK